MSKNRYWTNGATPKQQRAKSRRNIATIRKALITIAGHWDDMDHSVIYEIDELLGQLEELETVIDAAVDRLEEMDTPMAQLGMTRSR